MFNLFKSKPTSFIGVDIGTSSIKLVELENVGGRPRLVTYGLVESDVDIARKNKQGTNKEDQEEVASVLKSLLEKSRAKSTQAVAALPNFSVFSSVISLPKLEEKQLAEAVKWEAKKFVPMPIENVVLDWKILSETEQNQEEALASKSSEENKQEATDIEEKVVGKSGISAEKLAKCKTVVQILLTAAPRHLVERYAGIFKFAGLNLLSLETESFALARSLVGNDEGTMLVSDVGSLTTDLMVVKKGVPIFSRSIDVGGKTITTAISEAMGIAPERAEQFKHDTGMSAQGGGRGEQAKGGVSGIIQERFAPVINEMKYTLDLQKKQGHAVEKILLTGGSAFLSSLDTYIAQSLGVKVFIGNPWARVSYPKDISDVLQQLAPRMGVAIGLAMREIE
jgi:type IV pilus assembly protein PilM